MRPPAQPPPTLPVHDPRREECDGAVADDEQDWRAVILELLGQRAEGATICPSDAARAAGGERWRDRMDDVREAAHGLVADGEVEITQHGEVVDPSSARGPIRIRRRR
ncbi:hypothetical protein B5808_12345 [Cnuibacter physcomitrellae]|uniref:S-adenosylmethionine tRNA ribosyltransferase n=1 Tax=Cnuibacter physcomitrellae TaxID=1619308 RepID=A0A1X9LL37_9MICO|nr:hypothetical protein B5808_12345 [Cnuibacter physcomitrellae]